MEGNQKHVGEQFANHTIRLGASMNKLRNASRRTVLKTIGAGVIGGAVLTGSATAQENHYGRGNGLDEFLNEEALFKENPIWDGEIANRMGEEVVDVAVGALTAANIPDPEAPPQVPFAFAPMVVKVSPGATVRWTWVSNPYDVPIPHDVTSLVNDDGEVVLERDAGQRYHHHDQYTPATEMNDLEEDVNPTFEQTFEDRGNHLYYCTPHGAPFEVCHDGQCIYNPFGMRGAVQVAGKSLSD